MDRNHWRLLPTEITDYIESKAMDQHIQSSITDYIEIDDYIESKAMDLN